MRHWTLLGEAEIPESNKSLRLYRGKDDFHITLFPGGELMNTRRHGSEDALGRLACAPLNNVPQARVLIGGLGMGFTLAAALQELRSDATVTVAELIPEIVQWNRGPLGEFAGNPLADHRTRVWPGDVVELIRSKSGEYHAIALDVDNGPEGLTQENNDRLYSDQGIAAACRALVPRGILAYWSAGPDREFLRRLVRTGLKVEEHRVHAHGRKGQRHTLWIAKKPD